MSIVFETWHFWVILALALAAMEMLGLGFVALAIGVSCIAGAVAALMDQPLWVQIAATAVAAAILTPLFVHWYKKAGVSSDPVSVTGDGGSLGQICLIVSQQDRLGVVIKGDFFPARLVQQNAGELQVGQQVEVKEFSGITAMVAIVDSNPETLDR
ncbi:NfeD family protein [Motiliproteus sp. MSK22-1]|uniref:NfeD family protein n=1 Tax=Motiliproteus sp. MSK22-1 TaxID=1897630 RepID=UPI000978C2C4|nr:NfeD family protein [Motiliproteus sp. MSK22-1]OMH38071.1 hypothetical protein BGP75_07265 [Motiliproteus sp. MSK22-1]